MAAHHPDACDVVRALRRGPATLEALRARLGGPAADALDWALQDALARGWARSSVLPGCGPDGVCSTSAPAVVTVTRAGLGAAAGSAAESG